MNSCAQSHVCILHMILHFDAGLVVHCFFVVNPAPGSENDRWLGSGSGRAEDPPVGFGSGIRR